MTTHGFPETHVLFRKLTSAAPGNRARRGLLALRRGRSRVPRCVWRCVRRERGTWGRRDRRCDGGTGAAARLCERDDVLPRARSKSSRPSWRRSRRVTWTGSTHSRVARTRSKPRSSSRGSTGWRPGERGSTRSLRSLPPTTGTRCSRCPRPRASTTGRSIATGSWTSCAFPRHTRIAARAVARRRTARRAAVRRSKRRSSARIPRRSRHSSPSRWEARPRAHRCRRRSTSVALGRSATATTCCSSRTRCWSARGGRARGRRWSRAASCLT